MPKNITQKIDAIVEKTNHVNRLIHEISKITNGKHHLNICEYGKKRKKQYITVCVDISNL